MGDSASSSIPHSLRLFLLCLAYRTISAWSVGHTAFNPDEYWQSMEVAYRNVWNGGFYSWEYQQHAQLRGVAHPLLFTAFYALLKYTHLDSRFMVAHGPRFLQGLIAAVGDYFLYRLAQRLSGSRAAAWTLFSSFVCWFSFYAVTRTFSNSMEASLFVIALYYWPDTSSRELVSSDKDGDAKASAIVSEHYNSSRRKALILAALTFVIRPTNAVLWVFLGVYHLVISLPNWRLRMSLLTRDVLPIALITLVVSSVIDTMFYSPSSSIVGALFPWNWSIVSWNFVRLNSGSDLSSLYGTHPWYWYLTEGIATNLGTLLIPFNYAAFRFCTHRFPIKLKDGQISAGQLQSTFGLLLCLMLWAMFVFSFNAHKEPRFLLCILPVPFLFVGHLLATLQQPAADTSASTSKEKAEPSTTVAKLQPDSDSQSDSLRQRKPSKAAVASSESSPSSTSVAAPRSPSKGLWLALFLLVTQLPMMVYFTFVHQSGPPGVMNYIEEAYQQFQQECSRTQSCDNSPFRVHFTMQCHSMPLYSFLHHSSHHPTRTPRAIDLQFLDCSPLFIQGKLYGNGSNPCCASAQLRENPVTFLKQYYGLSLKSYERKVRMQQKLIKEGKQHEEANQQLLRATAARPLPASAQSGEMVWPWYESGEVRQCFRKRLHLNESQILSIDNEFPGGSVWTNLEFPTIESIMPHLIVIDEAYKQQVEPFFNQLHYQRVASIFHSHLDDVKHYLIFQKLVSEY